MEVGTVGCETPRLLPCGENSTPGRKRAGVSFREVQGEMKGPGGKDILILAVTEIQAHPCSLHGLLHMD